MRVTIAGMNGSGKSTVSRYLAEALGLTRYSMGDMRRKMAIDRGITLEELNALGEKEGWTDTKVDEYQVELGKKEDNFIIEGKLSGHFIPDSIKVFLTVNPDVGAKRIFEHQRPEERYGSLEEMRMKSDERIESDKRRYMKLYGVNPYNITLYDIVIDTSDMDAEKMKSEVERAIRDYAQRHGMK